MFELLIYRPDSNRDIDLLNWSFDLCQLYNNIQVKVNDLMTNDIHYSLLKLLTGFVIAAFID